MRALGLDVGGTKALAVVMDGEARVLARHACETGRATAPEDVIALVRALAAELSARGCPVDAVGIGFPGLVDAAAGVVRSSVILDRFRDVPLAALVAEAAGVPCAIDNDVNAAARAEIRARGAVDGVLLFVAVGTGIGGAIAVNGRLLRGGGFAGEIGHTTIAGGGPPCACGRRGCLNAIASGAAIERALEIPDGTLRDRVRGGDPRVIAAVQRAARALGAGVANAMSLLHPFLVVLAGGVAQIDGFVGEVAAAARAEALPEVAASCRVEAARAGYDAGAMGAALLAMDAAREA